MQRLSPNEVSVLAVAGCNARLSAKEIGKLTKLKTHTVHRTLNALHERGVISPFLVINPHTLGLNDFCLFFNVSSPHRDTGSRVIKYCIRSPLVAYFSELMGEYQYSVSLFSESAFIVDDFIRGLQKELPGCAIDLNFAIRLVWNIYNKSFDTKRHNKLCLSRGKEVPVAEIDELDREFLVYYSAHPYLPLLKVGKELGVSEATLRLRLKRLMEKKIVLGMAYYVNWSICGYIPARVLLNTKSMDADVNKELLKLAASDARITEYVKCLGAWDHELNFQVQNVVETGQFTRFLHENFADSLHSIKTIGEIALHKLHRFPEVVKTSG